MHLHIISAGEHIHETFPTTVKHLKGITHVGVVVEENIYRDNPEDPDHMKRIKPKIRESIAEVNRACELFSMKCNEIRIPDTSLISVRDAILSTASMVPDARFSFNLSGGTKMLSLSLFTMAIWLDGEIYLTPDTDRLEPLAIPRMHLNDVRHNPNYVHALQILSEMAKYANPKNETGVWILGKDFSRTLMSRYQPVRFTGDSSTKKTPNRGTITKIIAPLEEWGLVEERQRPGNKREKEYRLTRDGKFALAILQSENKQVLDNIAEN